MANPILFQSFRGKQAPKADTKNHSGTPAYSLSPQHQLAQLAATGCLNQTFYTSAGEQLDKVLELTTQNAPEFLAKTAIYARQQGHMKDMPALLAATLAVRDIALLTRIFPQLIDSGKMLRNFVQILRSGQVGRKSLGTRPKKLVQQWLLTASEKQLLSASIGNQPSLADVVKMVHPKPTEPWRAAWFAWLIGKPFDEAALPPLTRAFEQFKRAPDGEAPDIPFQMLTTLNLSVEQLAKIAQNMSWQALRQNLNTCTRQGVFELPGLVRRIAKKLSDKNAITRARVMPYQLMAAYGASLGKAPAEISEALQDAMEVALTNVPTLSGKVVVCPDVSPSMHSSVTGFRRGATSAIRCIDVSALLAAAVLRKNTSARILPFAEKVVNLHLNPRDSVLTNAQKLAALGGAGTACSAPLALLNQEKAKVDLVLLISDNESWIDSTGSVRPWQSNPTQTMHEWERLKQGNPKAKLVCIDIQPYSTTQALERTDILNIGGFSDAVFTLLSQFAEDKLDSAHWVGEIEKIALPA